MRVNKSSVKIVVPTYNAGDKFSAFIKAVKNQLNVMPEDVLIIDSSSVDNTVMLAKQAGFSVTIIPHDNFSHGGTRAGAVDHSDAEIIVFLTQDAILAKTDSIEKLIAVFKDEKIAAVYGRQLPNAGANAFSAFARLFNYGDKSFINKLEDRKTKGIKVAFFSDSFSAYRRESLLSIGNLDKDIQYGEDMVAAAKLLLAGYETAYCSEACVYHSHNFSLLDEFNRYRETGSFHKRERWLLKEFGKAEGEGLKFVLAELQYLFNQEKFYLIPLAFVRNFAKYVGYWVGMHF